MLDGVEDVIRQASNLAEKPLGRAIELSKELVQRGQGHAEDIAGWGRRWAGSIGAALSAGIRRQLKAAGMATRDDIDRLDRRMRNLERSRVEPVGPEEAAGAGRAVRTKRAASPASTGRGRAKRSGSTARSSDQAP
ncbi:MAG: hypothetical protein ACRD0D_09970 [Acidimicrobiales bacterium]